MRGDDDGAEAPAGHRRSRSRLRWLDWLSSRNRHFPPEEACHPRRSTLSTTDARECCLVTRGAQEGGGLDLSLEGRPRLSRGSGRARGASRDRLRRRRTAKNAWGGSSDGHAGAAQIGVAQPPAVDGKDEGPVQFGGPVGRPTVSRAAPTATNRRKIDTDARSTTVVGWKRTPIGRKRTSVT